MIILSMILIFASNFRLFSRRQWSLVNPGEVNPGEVNPGEVNPGEINPGEVTPNYQEMLSNS